MNTPHLCAAVQEAAQLIASGGVIVYPTEAVWGLGCDFLNRAAVMKLLQLKNRPVEKGLILIASRIEQLHPYIQPTHTRDLERALGAWPGHSTFVFPKSPFLPDWISGAHPSVAVRVSAHPTVIGLCEHLGQAIVSTSANVSGQATFADLDQIQSTFGDAVDGYLDRPLGGLTRPSQIIDAASGEVYRES